MIWTPRQKQLVRPSVLDRRRRMWLMDQLDSGGAAPVAKSSLLTGLVAYYAFETLTLDSTGNGYTLVNHNTVTQGTGIIGQAASFASASNQYLTASAWMTNFPFTWAGWVNPTSFPGANQFIISIGQSFGDEAVAFYANSLGQLLFTANNYSNTITTAVTISTGTWTHVAITYDGTTCNIYKNGTKDVNSGALANSFSGITAGVIGTYGANNSNWNGLVDEMGVWSVILSQAQITSLYNSGAGRTYPFAGAP